MDLIDGVRCVPDLESLRGKVDLFVVVLPAASTPGFVAEIIERDLAESLIVIPGGLEETEGGGHSRHGCVLRSPARVAVPPVVP